ncbi:MAG: molybdopterin-binding protein [Pseudomonadota bacterium]
MTGPTVTAAVLIIGNEILSGRTQDTNLNYIATTLGSWGISVRECRVVADIEAEIVTAVNELRGRYRYLFTTGGIGPTHDDITAVCVARAFDRPVVEHPEIAAVIRRREAPEPIMRNRLLMARVPDGAGLIDNPTGGPQGFFIENVYVMAGIPRVMQAMLGSLEGKLETGAVVRSRSVTAYLGESQVAEALGRIQDAYPDLDLGSYPFLRDDRYGTTLVIRGTSTALLDEALGAVEAMIRAAGAEPQDQQR